MAAIVGNQSSWTFDNTFTTEPEKCEVNNDIQDTESLSPKSPVSVDSESTVLGSFTPPPSSQGLDDEKMKGFDQHPSHDGSIKGIEFGDDKHGENELKRNALHSLASVGDHLLTHEHDNAQGGSPHRIQSIEQGNIVSFDHKAEEVVKKEDLRRSMKEDEDLLIVQNEINAILKKQSNEDVISDQSMDGEKSDDDDISPSPRPKRKKSSSEDDEYIDNSAVSIVSPQPVRSKRMKIMTESPDSHYVDITNLLPLPQKEAANMLGISESMLCKRFKESTKRKWPFRFLKKIEKTIKSLEHTKQQGTISSQEQMKLDDLLAKKEECLAPVKIRITNHDRVGLSSSPSPRLEEEEFGSESDDEFAVETLGLLRSMSPANNKSNSESS